MSKIDIESVSKRFKFTQSKWKLPFHEDILTFIAKSIVERKMAQEVRGISSQICESWSFEVG